MRTDRLKGDGLVTANALRRVAEIAELRASEARSLMGVQRAGMRPYYQGAAEALEGMAVALRRDAGRVLDEERAESAGESGQRETGANGEETRRGCSQAA